MDDLKLKDFKMRLVNESDAEFILKLRTDENLAKHLHPTSSDLEQQRKWLRDYKQRESNGDEYYFIAESYLGEKLGVNRLYHFKDNTFEVGSWIFKKGLNESIPILADISVREFAFDILRFEKCIFDVRKDNKSVVRYHKLFKPTLISEDELNYYFELDSATFQSCKQKIKKLLNYGN